MVYEVNSNKKIYHIIQHSTKYLLKRNETYVHTNTCTQIFTAALFPIVKNCKPSKCPSTGERLSPCGT